MSNLPAGMNQLVLWLAVAGAFVVLTIFAVLVLRRGSIAGPDRMLPGESLGPLVGTTLSALGLWILIPAMFAASLEASRSMAATGSATQAQQVHLTPTQRVGLSLFSALAVSVVLVGAHLIMRPGRLSALGMGLRALPRGIPGGVLASLLVVPLALLVGVFVDVFWRFIRYEHPGVHEMLEILEGSEDPLLRAGIYISAIVVAPFFEELLFRGHVQTVLVQTLRNVLSPEPRRLPQAGASPDLVDPHDPVDPVDPVLNYASPRRPPNRTERAARWVAVFITSALFASVHGQLWMMPPIFFLSVCLGYVYERTGNLWSAMVVHMLFNAVNVTVFVYLVMR